LRQILLTAAEPPAFAVDHERGASRFVIVADHASNRIPQQLAQLGISDAECERHIAWDIGASAVSTQLGAALDAVVIRQSYSRLVIDCNRALGAATSIATISEATPIPGNVGLTEVERDHRAREIFQPYHDRIAVELDRRLTLGQSVTLVAVHSFTPVFHGVARPWHCGVLYNRNPHFARKLLELLRQEDGLVCGDNEPYSLSDDTDYTIPVHGERRGLPCVEIEIRQDLIATAAGQCAWAARLARLLPRAQAALSAASTSSGR
jgi:predicted N-formylglutamate amidohydrolase